MQWRRKISSTKETKVPADLGGDEEDVEDEFKSCDGEQEEG